ncbi:GNAT family N-acetyltransferase [Anaerococcus sp. ENR1011]|uniref:GNAT family N-acetyltransferase n=1 Tax=Anaerococcus groningensis TaxID=3115616 RepID=A0ABW9N1S5_9FIRM
MQVESLKLTSSTDKNYFENLYKTAFLKEEQVAIQSLYELNNKNLIDINFLKVDCKKIGLAVIYLNQDLNLLSYFAIEEKYRGQGLGTRALALLKDKYDNLIVEIESTNLKKVHDHDLRKKRKDFYLKNGYKVLDGQVNYFGIEMELMATTKDAGIDEYFDTYYKIFNKDYINKNIKIIEN